MDMVDYIVYSGGNTDAEAAEYLSQKMEEILSTADPTDSTSGRSAEECLRILRSLE